MLVRTGRRDAVPVALKVVLGQRSRHENLYCRFDLVQCPVPALLIR